MVSNVEQLCSCRFPTFIERVWKDVFMICNCIVKVFKMDVFMICNCVVKVFKMDV